MKRLREFLKGGEIDPNNVQWTNQPAAGMYVYVYAQVSWVMVVVHNL